MELAMRTVLQIVLFLIFAFDCAAFPTLPGQELAWKNVSVQGKRMSVYCIFKDSRGIVWLGTNNGLFFYDGVTTHSVSDDEISRNPTYSIIENEDGLLLGTGNGLVSYSFRDNCFAFVPLDPYPGDIRCMTLCDGTLWMGSVSGAFALRLDSSEVADLSEGLPHQSVYSLLSDSHGVIYAGTYEGLARWDKDTGFFREVPLPEGGSRFVNCLLQTRDGAGIYVGTEDALYCFTPASGILEKNLPLSGGSVKSLAESNEGHLLVGTDHGLFDVYDNQVRHFFHDIREDDSLSNSEIWCVLSDDAGYIWAGHEVGFSVASARASFRSVKLSAITGSGEGNDLHNIYRDSKGNLWLSGTNGIIKLSDDSSPRWYMPSDAPHSLSHVHIRDIKEDSEGVIWLATDGGINRYNAVKDNFDVFRVVDKEGNYASNWAYAVEEDDGNYLVGSYLGGMHVVARPRFRPGGGVVVSDQAVNTGSPVFKGRQVPLNNDLVHNIIKDPAGNIWILCFSDSILTEVPADDSPVKRWDIGELTGASPALIALDGKGRLWCAFKGGAVLMTGEPQPPTVYFPKTDTDESILTMAPVGDDMWFSTASNIWKVDGTTLEAGLLPIRQQTYKAIFADPLTGQVYLGGNDVVALANPAVLSKESVNSSFQMLLSQGKDGSVDMSGIMPGPEGLSLPYGGSLMLLVSTLDYSPDAAPRFMYKLATDTRDTDGGWTILPEGYNTISLPELKTGKYELLLKTAGSPGAPFSLPVKVRAPWYLSWWAFLLYIVTLAVLFELGRRLIIKRKQWLLNLRNKLTEAVRIEFLTQGKPIEAESLHEKQLAKDTKIIEDNVSNPELNVAFLSEKSGLPEKQLYRVVKKFMDVGPSEHIRNVRLKKAAALLVQNKFTVAEVCYMVGFTTPSYFTKCFKEKYGVKPSQYKETDIV